MHFTPEVMRIFVIGLLGALAELKQLLERGARQPNARAPATVSLRHGELRRATKQIEKQLTTLKKSNRNDELLAHQIAVLEEQLRIGETFRNNLLAAAALPREQRPCARYLIDISFIGGDLTPKYCDVSCGCSIVVVNAPEPRSSDDAAPYLDALLMSRSEMARTVRVLVGGAAALAPLVVLERIARRCAAACAWKLEEIDVQGYEHVRDIFARASQSTIVLPTSRTSKRKEPEFVKPRATTAINRLNKAVAASQVRCVCVLSIK